MDELIHGGKQDMLEKKKFLLTANQLGLTKKQLMVPSFETTAKVFGQHFLIMRELAHKIEKLKQAYYAQNDRKKTWDQVDEIIDVLQIGRRFLDFPAKEPSNYYSEQEEDDPAIAGDAEVEAELAAAAAVGSLLAAGEDDAEAQKPTPASGTSKEEGTPADGKANERPDAIKEESAENNESIKGGDK